MNAERFNNSLNVEELDLVSGGTYKEYTELRDIINDGGVYARNSYKKWQSHRTHFDDEDNVVDYLREELGIKADLHGSFKDYVNPLAKSIPAEYTDMKTGKSLSHTEVVNRVRGFVKSL